MDGAVRICVLISGSGTNLQALIDALAATPPVAQARICLVVSSKGEKAERQANDAGPGPYGLERARLAGIPCQRLTRASLGKDFQPHEPDSTEEKKARTERSKVEYDRRLAELVLEAKPDLVVCLGYMRVLLPVFLDQLKAQRVQIINLHPALPGEYDGMHAIERAHADWLEGRTTRTGVMIHRVIEEVDAGAVVVKEEIPFADPEDKSLEVFEQKVHSIEWKLVVEGVRKVVTEIETTNASKAQSQ